MRHPRPQRRLASLLALLGVLVLPAASRADDVGAEAEFRFRLGFDFYQKGDYRTALEHFFVSNRLVPNRNVMFNIARAQEQLQLFPEAFRSYSLALDGETRADLRKRATDAMDRVAPHIVIVHVNTTPPGATVYVDRKDLGSRGASPAALGLPPGKHTILVEMPGYEPVEPIEHDLPAGTRKVVTLSLTRVLGNVVVDGPEGATIHEDSVDGPPLGVAPATLALPPGKRRLVLSRPGYKVAEAEVEVLARQTIRVRPTQEALTGSVVVRADVRDALVEVDGKVVGFAPSVLTLAVGKHRVRVSLAGFQPIEREVLVVQAGQEKLDVALLTGVTVSAASRREERLEDAPASVSIIGSQELRGMQYPTIAEALRGVRGFYLTNDLTYTFLGVRGFSRTFDYGNKVLILQDGAPLNDNLLYQSFSGFEGRTDLGDVERIEVIRGPGSVLYGTGAFFGVVNLVTRNRKTPDQGEISLSAVEYGVGRGRASAHVNLGPDAGFWASVGGGVAEGRDHEFQEYRAEPSRGVVRDRDRFSMGTLNGRLWYKAFTVQWFYHHRDKLAPTATYTTLFGEELRFRDTRGLVEVRFEPKLSGQVQLLSRAHVNHYQYQADQPYAPADGGIAREHFTGNWAGLEQRVVLSPSRNVRLTAGGEYQSHFTVALQGSNDGGPYLDTTDRRRPESIVGPFHVLAGYGLADLSWSMLSLSAGVRADSYSTFGVSVNPRLAVIGKLSGADTLKLMGGRAFRAPSAYERGYLGPTQIPAPDLGPEQILTGELEYSHRLSPHLVATGAGYVNRLTGLVVTAGGGTTEAPNRSINSPTPVLSYGAEAELRRELKDGWMASVQYAVQRTAPTGARAGELRATPNSPAHLGSVRGGAYLFGKLLGLFSRLSFETGRHDSYDLRSDDAVAGTATQTKTRASALWDVVLSGEAESGVSYSFGVYNAFDARYTVPVSREFFPIKAVPQSGRTLLVASSLRF